MLRAVMVDTSFWSKMVRKVELICVDLLFMDLKTIPEKRCFPRLELLAETWLIWYKIKS